MIEISQAVAGKVKISLNLICSSRVKKKRKFHKMDALILDIFFKRTRFMTRESFDGQLSGFNLMHYILS